MKLEGIREKVFLDRYALKDQAGAPIEKTPVEMWRRVAKGIARVEKKEHRKEWEKKFYKVMEDFKFLPGGRILAGAGTGFDVTYFNCFVIPNPPDSRGGIMQNLTQMIEIMAHGGGVGLNLSGLRPRGARVKKVNGFSSGPMNWAELYSLATKDIVQQGGCFSADTRIMTHRGLIPVEEIVKSKSSYYAATHVGYKQVTAKFDNGIKDIYEVTTSSGFKVKTTLEHRFLTFDKNGRFYQKTLADLQEGDDVVHLLSEWSDELPYVILNTNLPAPSKHSYGRKKVSLPKLLNEDLAFIVGAYDADGTKIPDEFSKNGKGISIAVANDRPEDLKQLMAAIERCFGIPPTTRKGDGAVTKVEFYSRIPNEFLKLNGLLKDYSVTVRVPQHIFTSPKRVVEAYIAGVFLGDGTNRGGKGGLRICTVSKEFAQDLQLLLVNLGIPAKIKIQVRKEKNWRTLYTVTVNGATFMKKFAKILTPYTQKVLDNPISVRNGFFGWPFNVVERFLYIPHFQRTQARNNPTTSQKSVMFLQQMAPSLQEIDKTDVEFLANCVPDKIVAINYIGKENVYDLEVENVHLLSGNGFYTSNSRRGALMLMIHDWHPDVEEFITVKQDLNKINGANLSVCVSDDFMKAVKNDQDWDLRYPDLDDPQYDAKWNGDIHDWIKRGGKVKVHKKIKASYLWNLICEAAWRSAEPGLHFLDRSNKRSNTWYFEKLLATNPCGEQPLGAWGVCNLGAMNLAAYVKDDDLPHDKAGWFDYESFGKDVRIAMRFLDNVIDDTHYFFKENEKVAKDIRRTGLGIMGIADTFIKMKIRYGSEESTAVSKKIFEALRDNSYIASSDIAKEKGSFPKYNKEKYQQGYHIKALPKAIREKIASQGIRNAVLLTIAPTGTTSLVAGVSSGVEPVYEFEYLRKTKVGNAKMYHPLYDNWRLNHPDEKRPDYFVSANDLIPEDHVKIQAIAQEYIDSSISKTVNAPNGHSVDDVKKLYMMAYDAGCKGITYMRDGSRLGVLQRVEEPTVSQPAIMKRPIMVQGVTYQTNTPVGEAFVTINHNEKHEPFEVFITIGKSGSDIAAMAEALGRTISLSLRLNGGLPARERIRQVIAQLAGIGGAGSVGFGKDRVRSLPDAVAKVLAKHYGFRVNGKVEDKEESAVSNGHVAEATGMSMVQQLAIDGSSSTSLFDLCPDCGAGTLAYEEGCKKCYSCGYSAC